jgi:4-hydroxy-tetrahydrodipicolinate synthase
LLLEEHSALLRTAVAAARGSSLKVIAGTGSNSTRESVHLTEKAAELGVDACLIVVPYYNRPSVDGIHSHFSRLNEIGIPLIVYNIPGRTGINLAPAVIAELVDACPNIVGLKASNGSLDEIQETLFLTAEKAASFSLLSGDDSLTLPILAVGGAGVISVAANAMPRVMSDLVTSFRDAGDIQRAAFIARTIHPVCTALLRAGPNPAPIKALMNCLGLAVGGSRLPLTALAREQSNELAGIVRRAVIDLKNNNIDVDAILDRLL